MNTKNILYALCPILLLSFTIQAKYGISDGKYKLQMAKEPDNSSTRRSPIGISVIDGNVTIKVFIDGKGPLLFVLDSGGGGSHVISYSAAEQIALKIGRKFTGYSASDKMEMSSIGVTDFRFENGFEHKAKLSATKYPFGADLGGADSADMVGTIGSPLFTKYIVEISFAEDEMYIHEPDNWSPPKDTHEIDLSVGLISQIAKIKASVNGIKTKLLVDTGAFPSLALKKSLARRANAKVTPEQSQILTASGPIDTNQIHLNSLVIDSLEVLNVSGFSLNKTNYPYGIGGVIGLGFFSCYHVWFAFPHKKIYLGKKSNAEACDFNSPSH